MSCAPTTFAAAAMLILVFITAVALFGSTAAAPAATAEREQPMSTTGLRTLENEWLDRDHTRRQALRNEEGEEDEEEEEEEELKVTPECNEECLLKNLLDKGKRVAPKVTRLIAANMTLDADLPRHRCKIWKLEDIDNERYPRALSVKVCEPACLNKSRLFTCSQTLKNVTVLIAKRNGAAAETMSAEAASSTPPSTTAGADRVKVFVARTVATPFCSCREAQPAPNQ